MFVTRLNKSARGVCEACGGGRTDCETAVMPEAPPEFLRSALDTPPIWSSTGLMETEIHTGREYIPSRSNLNNLQATTKTKRGQREKGDNPSKRGSSLDQTHSSEFAGQKEEGENHPGDDHGA